MKGCGLLMRTVSLDFPMQVSYARAIKWRTLQREPERRLSGPGEGRQSSAAPDAVS